MDRKRYNEDGVGSIQLLGPWVTDNKGLDFPRGYHIEFYGGMGMPGYGYGGDVPKLNGMVPGPDGMMKEAGGFGASLKKDYRRFYGTNVGMSGRGVGMARVDNYCEIDPNVVDSTVYQYCAFIITGIMMRSIRQSICRRPFSLLCMPWALLLLPQNVIRRTTGG